jgi:hypothetical protein
VDAIEFNFDGEWFPGCSGTLVRPNVVLSAADCMDFVVPGGLGIENIWVTFDPLLDPAAPRYYGSAVQVQPTGSSSPG